MGLFVDLISAAALVLFSLCSASEDFGSPLVEQREIPFDISRFLREMDQDQSMMQKEMDFMDLSDTEMDQDKFMMQKEVDLMDLLDSTAVSQDDVTADILTPRGRRPISGPPAMEYPVQFPPGRPSLTNLQAICDYGDRRPRYSDSYFPASGFSMFKRRAAAVNYAESWFSTCCKRNSTVSQELLCCATQAWERAVDYFCTEDTSVKNRIYNCCKLRGKEKLKCFERDAPNKNYTPTTDEPLLPMTLLHYSDAHFHFDKSACLSTSAPKHSTGRKKKKPLPNPPSQNVDISFPPGRPTTADIESLCLYRKQRPHYDLKCLPRKGYGWLARQSKTINRVEKGFKQCCKRKQDIFTCADGKWREEMDRFCKQDKGAKMNFPCCETAEGDERYDCFQARAPQPGYGTEPSTSTTATTQELSINQVCSTHKIIKKRFPVGFPLQSFVNQCCPLSTEEQSPCIKEKLMKMHGNLCTTRNAPSQAIRRCCRTYPQDISQCLSKILMDAISKATNVSLKKKKKCPLS